MQKFKKFLFTISIVCGLLSGSSALAQLNGINAYLAEQAAYGADVLYFYSNSSLIELSAQSSSGNVASFVWSQFNGSGWTEIKTESTTVSSLTGIGEGGYQVVVNDGTSTATYRCWVFVPAISNVEIKLVDSNCYTLDLSVTCDFKTLSYVNPGDGNGYVVSYQPTYQWIKGSETVDVTDVSTVSLDAPYEDGTYSVNVSSRLLNTASSSANNLSITAIAVKPAFTYTDTKDKADNELHTDSEGSAPMRLVFEGAPDGTTDHSQGNITAYTWVFGEAGKDYIPNPTFVFQDPGTYAVTLTVENEFCTNTSEPTTITVKEAFVEVPNVFTPNGDGQNDEFRVAYRSIKSFSIVIVNRWGRVVYESTNPAEGWNGKIGKQKAAPGVYFYDVHATGYDDSETFHKKGFLHLLVGKQ